LDNHNPHSPPGTAGRLTQAATLSVVDTGSGRVRGAMRDGVGVFLGIPYAAATDGDQRFRPPRPVSWAGVRDALEPAPRCPQKSPASLADYEIWRHDFAPFSEDCLALNVFTPAVEGAARLPVMVFLHPGGFHVGSAGAPCMEGSSLARRGVVVVTLNHRLGILGHLEVPGEPGSGNVGMLDCVAALQWVRQNIAQFGGDPDQVTIFGQSGGGSKVGVLMAMPGARGLFHRAIIQSASSLLALATPEQAERNTRHLLGVLGLEGAPPSRAAQALRALPAPDLLKAMTAAIAAAGHVDDFRPVANGVEIASQPFDAPALALSGHVPLLCGWCEHEQRLNWASTPGIYQRDEAQVQASVERLMGITPPQAAALLAAYRESRPGDSVGDLFAQIVGDHRYRRNVSLAADRQAAHGGRPVYRYVLSWRTPVHGGLLRAPHTLCLPFTFATVDRSAGLVGTGPEPLALQEQMADAWVAFARQGDPNHAGLPAWPPHDLAERPTMVFDRETRVESDPWRLERLAMEPLPAYRPALFEGGQKP